MLKQFFFFILLFFLYFQNLISLEFDSTTTDESICLAAFESEPSSFVGKVNVITGAYQEFEQDLVIPAPEPLIIQRAYCSMSSNYYDYDSILKEAWHLNHKGSFRLDLEKQSQSQLVCPFGCKMIFKGKVSSKDKLTIFNLNLDVMLNGLTNCSENRISGRTNKKIIQLFAMMKLICVV